MGDSLWVKGFSSRLCECSEIDYGYGSTNCKITINPCFQLVNYMEYELYLNKAIKKKKNSRESTLYPTLSFPFFNILHVYGTFVKINEHILIHYY